MAARIFLFVLFPALLLAETAPWRSELDNASRAFQAAMQQAGSDAHRTADRFDGLVVHAHAEGLQHRQISRSSLYVHLEIQPHCAAQPDLQPFFGKARSAMRQQFGRGVVMNFRSW